MVTPTKKSLPTPPRQIGDQKTDAASLERWFGAFHNNLVNETQLGNPDFQYAVQGFDPDDIDPDNLPDPTTTSIATAQQVANSALKIASSGDGGVALAAAAAAQASADASLKKDQNLADVDDANVARASLGAAPTLNPVFTGTINMTGGAPFVPTATANDNSTKAASTAYVDAKEGAATPLINGTAAVGSSHLFARENHVHPTDTTRAPLANAAHTGTLTLNGENVLTDTGAWTAWTPTITPDSGAFTAASASGRYKQIGKTVHFHLIFNIIVAGTAGNTFADLTLPVAPQVDGFTYCGRENASTGLMTMAHIVSGKFRIQGQVSSPATYPVSNGYTFDFNGSYETT